jgi:hypothetical protein
MENLIEQIFDTAFKIQQKAKHMQQEVTLGKALELATIMHKDVLNNHRRYLVVPIEGEATFSPVILSKFPDTGYEHGLVYDLAQMVYQGTSIEDEREGYIFLL